MAYIGEKLEQMFPTYLDYDGQRRAERLFHVIVILFGAVGLIWGYAIQQFSQTVYILGAGFALAAALVLPPWPMYRLKPLNWQKPVDYETQAATPNSNEAKKPKKKK
ncbi:unnamed protein product [Notodromas monacha]|uniref:Signal peptidase complex subunit 1 n=1 Tax=Notodromas monacha TaxID=399045 RepID=A0A7R9BF62_9CRUS|nr:unnamed protein product [Notodromas monacha]CAG0912980.1 unnamed protein product [Notodromas monacha]